MARLQFLTSLLLTVICSYVQTIEQPHLTSNSKYPETTKDGNKNIGEYLFVVGNGLETEGRRTPEIVSLTEGDNIPDCLNALSDHPNELYYAAGGALPDAGYLPHTCGSSDSPKNECWVYTPLEDTWTKSSTIPRDIYYAASAFHPAWGIIMSGGYEDYDEDIYSAEVTITGDAEYFEELEPMPYSSAFHCVAAINANTIFVTGLQPSLNKSFKYDRDTKEWVPLPNMPIGRSYLGCGVVRDASGKTEVVVVGGDYLVEVEIFDFEENSWRRASNPFPMGINNPSIAQQDNTFYVVGGAMIIEEDGFLDVVPLDTVYRYEASDESWQLMPNKMKIGRNGATSMIVNSTLFPTCD